LPEPLGESVRRELGRLGGAAGSGMAELVAAWPDSVGPAIANNAWPARVTRDGTLVVHTSSSTWAFELTQLEATVRERLGSLAPPKMRFAPGPIPSPHETVPTLEHSVPTPGPAAVRHGEEIARGIEDPELRNVVARAAAASLARATRRSGPTGRSDRLESA
jgi:hypothetical protein